MSIRACCKNRTHYINSLKKGSYGQDKSALGTLFELISSLESENSPFEKMIQLGWVIDRDMPGKKLSFLSAFGARRSISSPDLQDSIYARAPPRC